MFQVSHCKSHMAMNLACNSVSLSKPFSFRMRFQNFILSRDKVLEIQLSVHVSFVKLYIGIVSNYFLFDMCWKMPVFITWNVQVSNARFPVRTSPDLHNGARRERQVSAKRVGGERMPFVVEMPRNAEVETPGAEQRVATYQRENSTEEDIRCRQCHWTEKFRYPRIQNKM